MNKRYIIGAIVAAVAVVAVLVGVSLAGGDSKTVSSIEGAAAVDATLDGVAQKGNVLGDASAPVTIVEYADMACPFCKDASEDQIPTLITDYVRTGKATLEFRAIAIISSSSERGALGVEAAALQDKAWNLAELLYRNQGDERDDWLTDDLLEEAATKAGLDMDKWSADYAGDGVVTTFRERQSAASADQISGTPTFVVTGPRGTQTVDRNKVVEAVEAVGPAAP